MDHRWAVEAVVFDMDGVLVDSEDLWWEVRQAFAAGLGLRWTAQDQTATMGLNTAGWARVMVERLQLRSRAGMDESDVARAIIAGMRDAYDRRMPLRDGAVEAVRVAAGHFSKVALASGSPRELGDFVLRRAGLDGLFAATLYGDEVEHGKPAPDIYLRVLQTIGVAPALAVGIEDSGNGIRSLSAAGMAIVAAPGPGYPLSPEVLAMADAHIASMKDFDVEVVERAARGRAARPGPSRV